MSDAIVMIRLSATGPRPLGSTLYGISLDEYPLQPGKALWIRQVTSDTGDIKRYTSDQGSVTTDELDWEPL